MDKLIIFTDGASRGNPGPGGYGAVIVNKSEDHVWEMGGRADKTTNNRMELMAVIEALKRSKNFDGKIVVYTDSSYLINGITKWVQNWQNNNWKTKDKKDVLNKDLWVNLLELSSGKKIDFIYSAGHSGIVGNEKADKIATNFADNLKQNLFRGRLEDYKFDIFNLTAGEKKKASGGRSGKAFSYISEVDGEVKVHQTWAECEARVKGKRARFKKALNKEEEATIINEFRAKR